MQHAMPTVEMPVWDSDTDEVAATLGNNGTTDVTIPADCYYVIFSTDNAHTTGVFITVDGSGDTTGVRIGDGSGDLHYGTPTVPGTIFEIHNESGSVSIQFNTLRFYNKAKA